jgi:hypothetical protein
MKAQRRTARNHASQQTFEFAHCRPENLLRVEIGRTGVVISAYQGNFSPRDKEAFVRYLVDEGFISDQYRYFSTDRSETWAGLQWFVDGRISTGGVSGAIRRVKAFIVQLPAREFVAWAIQLGALFLLIRH